jgi:hypothetical protein
MFFAGLFLRLEGQNKRLKTDEKRLSIVGVESVVEIYVFSQKGKARLP